MRVAKWGAILLTLLMGLANLGELAQSNETFKIVGPVLAVAAVIAVIGFASARPWGARAVIALGAINLSARRGPLSPDWTDGRSRSCSLRSPSSSPSCRPHASARR
jgi:hypothetical protein